MRHGTLKNINSSGKPLVSFVLVGNPFSFEIKDVKTKEHR